MLANSNAGFRASIVPSRPRWRRAWRRGRGRWRAFSQPAASTTAPSTLNVAKDDRAKGTGADNGAEIDATRRCEPPCGRRGPHTAAPRGGAANLRLGRAGARTSVARPDRRRQRLRRPRGASATPALTSLSERIRASAVPTGTLPPTSTSICSIRPVFEDFDLDRALLSFNHGDDVATLHAVSRLDHPLDERARIHIGAERRHAKFGHGIRRYVRPSAALAAAIIFGACGIAASSRWRAYGIGTSSLHTRPTGASSSQNACSTIRVQISAARLPLRQPSSTMIARRVLVTEAMIVWSSSGRKVRRSMTSASMLSAASAAAASSVFHNDPP